MLRNPDVRHRVAEHQRALAHTIAEFMEEQASHLGVNLRIPAPTLARIALAAGDGLELASHLHETDDDLYEPFLELLLSAWDRPPVRTTRRGGDTGGKARKAARSMQNQP